MIFFWFFQTHTIGLAKKEALLLIYFVFKYILHFILLYSTLIFPFFLFPKFEWFMNVNPYMVIQLWDIAGKLTIFFHILTRRKWTFEQRIIYLTFYLQDLFINFTSSAILLAISKRSTLHHLTSHLSLYPFIPSPMSQPIHLTPALPCPAPFLICQSCRFCKGLHM